MDDDSNEPSLSGSYLDDEDDQGSLQQSSTNSSIATGSGKDSEDPIIGKQETKAVNISKAFVVAAICLAAVGMGTATYLFTSNDENSDFENEFRAHVAEIETIAENRAASMFGQVRSLSTLITSFANNANATFPNVTLPHFDKITAEVSDLSGIRMIVYSPIVQRDESVAWESYAVENQDWLASDAVRYKHSFRMPETMTDNVQDYGSFNNIIREDDTSRWYEVEFDSIRDQIYDFGVPDEPPPFEGATFIEEISIPVWQYGPAPVNSSLVNLDLNTHPIGKYMFQDSVTNDRRIVAETDDLSGFLRVIHALEDQGSQEDGDNEAQHYEDDGLSHADELFEDHKHTFVVQPVYASFEPESVITGFLLAIVPWYNLFIDIPEDASGFIVEIEDTCGERFSFTLSSGERAAVGGPNAHNPRYDSLGESFLLTDLVDPSREAYNYGSLCDFKFTFYPSEEFEDLFVSNKPILYTVVVVLIFVFTALVFLLYDWMVQRRQNKVMNTAIRTNAVVSSLFPKSVGQRLLADADHHASAQDGKGRKLNSASGNKALFKDFLVDGEMSSSLSKPIADLFPETTVLFADIVGFTAWSSAREPTQVFALLETVYREFDEIARHRRVFKVETVGDCYVAVVGLPDPRKDHHVVMARFARDCLDKFVTLTKRLEVELGPDTAELGVRIGVHSGPVTAGVLRGERARFQLFGDTVNTTARIETTGMRNRIQLSQETADLLFLAGKGHWLTPRNDRVMAKGKGSLQTYWLEVKGDLRANSKTESTTSGNSGEEQRHDGEPYFNDRRNAPLQQSAVLSLSEKHGRLVDWNTEILVKLLKEIVARRRTTAAAPGTPERMASLENERRTTNKIVIDEVKEIITLPSYNAQHKSTGDVHLSDAVIEQLRGYVRTIAALYRNNPFHNFEHASHVTMSCVKLLSRIVAPDLEHVGGDDVARSLHDHTYGITSDPLTQFAVILSGLFHDVDHTGVPNAQLVKEKSSIATVYRNKSVAEQNSVDIAWDLLMEDTYKDLRCAIYANEQEFRRFRQLIVNTVMATDIMDKDLKNLRNARWDKAFAEGARDESAIQDVNRKATIVIEHLIQASDVAHTMQHWHIYRKWNARLFEEMYKAYVDGRSDKDPSENWYEGEIGFFDFYIIPLAMKLRSCGVFGVSSDEYLTYARQNRKEWELRGREVVEEVMENVKKEKWYSQRVSFTENMA